MLHWRDNWFFGRTASGSVRILKFAANPPIFPKAEAVYPSAVVDLVIPESEWASIVASVSYGGEQDGRYFAALKLHQSTGIITHE